MNTNENVAVLPPRLGLRSLLLERPLGRSSALVLGGSIVMLLGSGVVSALNFGYNVAMARMLGPAAFGDVSAVATLFMLASAVTLSFQLVCAKFVARNESIPYKAMVYRQLIRRAWVVGLAFCAFFALARGPISAILTLHDPMLVLIMAAGIAFYVPLGVKRGAMQGLCNFQQLTGNFVMEAGVKFVAAVALVSLGYGILGAVGALAASVVVAFLYRPQRWGAGDVTGEYVPASFREGIQAIVFFVGQVVINNIDILLVKYYFQPRDAGMYAAVALVGRVLYFAAWSIVSAMFPVTAAAKSDQDSSRTVVLAPFFLVLGISAAFAAILAFFPHMIVGFVFGHSFHEAEGLMSLYAVATGLYSLSVVLMAFEMSRKIANTGWLQLLFSGLLVIAISMFHHTLREVVMVQVVMMLVLLAMVSIPFFKRPPLVAAQPGRAA